MQPQFLQGLREMAQYLGAKLDTLASATRAPVKIDIGKSSEELANAAKALTVVTDTLEKSERSMNMASVVSQLQSVLSSIERQAQAVGMLAGKVTNDEAKRTNALLMSLTDAVNGIKLEEKDTDLSALNDLKTIAFALQKELERKNTGAIEAKLDSVIQLMRDFKVKLPEVVKFDKDQLKQLVSASGYGGGGSVTTAMVPRTTVVANVALTTANTQYSYTLPKNAVAFYAKLRGVDQQFTYAWVTGKMPTSGDGTAYMTTTYNFLQSRDGVDFGGKTLYVQCDASSQVLEIESYIA
jgi:hypothetical protein